MSLRELQFLSSFTHFVVKNRLLITSNIFKSLFLPEDLKIYIYSVYYESIKRDPKIRREVDGTYTYREGAFRRNGPSENRMIVSPMVCGNLYQIDVFFF